MVKICLLITSTWKAGCASEDGEKSLRKCKQAVTRVHVRFIFLMCYWFEHLIQNKHYLVYKIQSLLPPLASVRIWKEASLWKQQMLLQMNGSRNSSRRGGKTQSLLFIPSLFISSSASWFAEILRQETVSALSSEWPFSSCSLLNGATQVTISKCISFGMRSLRFGRGIRKSSKEAS